MPSTDTLSMIKACIVAAGLSTALWYFFEYRPSLPAETAVEAFATPSLPNPNSNPQRVPVDAERRQPVSPARVAALAARLEPAPDLPAPPRQEAAPRATLTSIYLCRSYQGARFWASNHCQEHQALIERIHSVSTSLPWPQQVEIASREAQVAQTLYAPTTSNITAAGINAPSPPLAESVQDLQCVSIQNEIRAIDAITRQPLSARQQDHYRERRRALMSQAKALRC